MTDQPHANPPARPAERRTPNLNFWVNRPLGFTRRVRQGIHPTVQPGTTSSHR